MFGSLRERLRHGSYLKNEQGIKKFAERAMGNFIQKVTKESANYREMNENLLVEKANLRLRQNELQKNDKLDSGEFFSMRRRMRAMSLLTAVFVIASVFMNAISVTAIIAGDTALLGTVMQWVAAIALALVLTGGGLIITERLIEAIMPQRTRHAEHVETTGAPMAVLWGILLVGILIAIYGFSSVRAAQFASEQGGGALYLAFVALAILLPIAAGAVRYDTMRYVDVYKTTQTLREIESRLAQIDSILRQNDEHESNFYKINSISFWDKVNRFKTHKDNYNEENGLVESLQGHFARSYDAFQNEASKRYEADIRDVTSRSMRHLGPSSRGEARGRKLGQQGEGGDLMMPAASPEDNSERDDVDEAASEDYLEPQPVR
ncbi:MAG: hypothetical protein BRD37_08455 [Bacteroidetes bacterium QH_8_67_23]|nr:MAG: hypothetical protein BRD37_08455 [Bacteroidetes bacterium QH_8_67_23]